MTAAYEQKLADFRRMCDQAKKGNLDVVGVHDPETLGDDYAEIVESLNRLADPKLQLSIVPRYSSFEKTQLDTLARVLRNRCGRIRAVESRLLDLQAIVKATTTTPTSTARPR